MKRNSWYVALLVMAAVFWGLAGCGGDKYKEARVVFSDQAEASEKYIEGLDKAQNASDVVKTIDAYTQAMKALIPRMMALKEKHPQWWSEADEPNLPEELAAEGKRMEAVADKLQSATANMMKYMMDPQVQQAMQRMGEEMGALVK